MRPPRAQPDFPPDKHSRFSRHGRRKQRIQDHAQWSAYLAKRRILDQAIAVGAWIEYSDYYGRYSLVWHEKRRDGSRGARRRRFIDPPVIKGKALGKSIWFPGELFHYLASIDELKHEIAHAGGALNIVEGEIGVSSMHCPGISKAVGSYGISNIADMSKVAPPIQQLQERVQAAMDEAAAENAAHEEAAKKSGADIRTNIVREIGDARNDSTNP